MKLPGSLKILLRMEVNTCTSIFGSAWRISSTSTAMSFALYGKGPTDVDSNCGDASKQVEEWGVKENITSNCNIQTLKKMCG